jgi:penicillin-binding protein 2
VGISGIEKAMESELQGDDGVRTITFENGIAVSDEITDPVEAGHTVMLTVNSEFQRGLQEILQNFLTNFQSINDKAELANNDVISGAIVVLDVKTGAILGEATAPTYDLTLYSENYSELLEEEGNPLYNRATMGLYRPGSTFKTITATAGLNEGIVNGSTSYLCNKVYHYIDTDYKCTGNHGYISIARALMVSCNSYFYELSRNLTIDRITEYAAYYGIGQNTGIETQDAAGYMASPEKYKELGLNWTVGQVLQAGIGNGETMVTPLQLANVACTIANKGVRYEPHLVDSIWDYNLETCLEKTEPTVAAEIPLKNSYVYDYIEQGMILASTNNFPSQYSLENLGYQVAIKTGTPQSDSHVQDSVFLGYAPADDPQIAFAGVVEGGEYSKYMIRSILKLYEEVYGME